MTASPSPTEQTLPQQEAGTRPSPSGPVPSAGVPEAPFTLGEAALGAVTLAGAWWLRRIRSGPDEYDSGHE